MKNINYLISLIFILISCVDKEKVLDNGIELKYFKNGNGEEIKDGQIVMINLQYFDYDGNESK